MFLDRRTSLLEGDKLMLPACRSLGLLGSEQLRRKLIEDLSAQGIKILNTSITELKRTPINKSSKKQKVINFTISRTKDALKKVRLYFHDNIDNYSDLIWKSTAYEYFFSFFVREHIPGVSDSKVPDREESPSHITD